jgi:hypothetical protein
MTTGVGDAPLAQHVDSVVTQHLKGANLRG